MRTLFITLAALAFAQTASAQTFRNLQSTAQNCLNGPSTVYNVSHPYQSTPPLDLALMRVGYWGDPWTNEAIYAVANPIQWPVEQLLNIPSATYKRGYYDVGLPVATSAIAASCTDAGFMLNTYQFTHTQSVFGGGPQGGLEIKSSLPRPIYSSTSSQLVIQGYVKHPAHHWNEEGAVGQIILAYYVQPRYCPHGSSNLCPAATADNNVPAFAHVIALYASNNASGTYDEFFDSDGFTGFFSSPLANYQANGSPPQFLTKSVHSYPMATRYELWQDYRFYRAQISYAQMANMIAIQRAANPSIAAVTSPHPTDWGIVLVTGLVETFPNAQSNCFANQNNPGCRNISMAVAMSYVESYEMITPCTGPACPRTKASGPMPILGATPPTDYEATRATMKSGPSDRFEYTTERARALLQPLAR